MIHKLILCVFATMIATIEIGSAHAAQVAIGVSQQETYVGLPISLQVQISNASKHDPPIINEIDGLEIEAAGTPSRSSQISIVNGRRSESSSVTYSYRITPRREGTFTIPPINVIADGETHQTRAVEFAVTKSETGDLMFVEIEGKQDSIYVGQALELTLKIWLRPYRDRKRSVVLSESDMWNMISDATSWGPFADRKRELDEDHKRPGGEEVLRADDTGQKRSYYLYEINATVYPQKPGKIDSDDVQIVVRYPTALGKARDPFASFFGDDDRFPFRSRMFSDDMFAPFGSRLSIKSVRPIAAETSVEDIQVKPIPTKGRPVDYRGAVGQYQIATEVKSTKVKAGDPITLHIGVAGSGPMELVQAPPLAEIEALSKDFKVPDEPLAGFVDGSQKVFTTSIRPRRQGIEQIPPIPFSYFDPDQEEFVTVYSEPIAIEVDEAETLTLDSIVANRRSADHDGSSQSSSGSIVFLQNFSGTELLVDQTPFQTTLRNAVGMMALPPLVLLSLLLLRFAARGKRLLRRPLAQAQRAVEASRTPSDVALALHNYLESRFAKQIAGGDAMSAVGLLRRHGDREMAIRLERLLQRCPQSLIVDERELSEMKQQAQTLIRGLSGKSVSSLRRPVIRGAAKRVGVGAGAFLMAVCISHTTVSAAESISLSQQQMTIVVNEANELYAQSQEVAGSRPADSKELAARAAEKYQMVVDAGVTNAKLFFNLGNAYQQSGQAGRAIANYRRALKIEPANSMFRNNLQYAETVAGTADNENPVMASRHWIAAVNSVIHRWVSPTAIGAVAMIAWCLFWMIIAWRMFKPLTAWKSIATCTASIFLLAAVSYVDWLQRTTDTAIVVASSVTLYEGDGDHFAKVAHLEDVVGQEVKLLHRRGDWANVKTPNGRMGWVASKLIEQI